MKDSSIQNLQNVSVKYDNINYICIFADNQNDLCDTPGLNYFGCLSTKADRCDWVNNKCVKYSDSIEYSTCEQYQTVSPKVCSSITLNNIKCYHDSETLSCKTFVETTLVFVNFVSINKQIDICILQMVQINKLVLVSLNNQVFGWMKNANSIEQLMELLNVTNQKMQMQFHVHQLMQMKLYVNIYQMVNAHQFLILQPKTQQRDFDIILIENLKKMQEIPNSSKIDTCKTIGLNRLGCVLVENDKCQFVDYKCQYYDGDTSVCNNLINVNKNVCIALNTQGCKFSYLSRGCVDVYSNDKCDAPGLNQIGCLQLPNCKYINSECFCSGLTQLYDIIDCTDSLIYSQYTIYTMQNCTASQCIFDLQQSKCRVKNCNDISLDLCESTKINQYQCYKNKSQCQAARKCSDLFNVSDCTKFTINNKKCNIDLYCLIQKLNSFKTISQRYKTINCFNLMSRILFSDNNQRMIAYIASIPTYKPKNCFILFIFVFKQVVQELNIFRLFLLNKKQINLFKTKILKSAMRNDGFWFKYFNKIQLKIFIQQYNQNHCIEQSCIHLTQDQCSGNCMWSYYECQIKQCTYMKKEECTGSINNEQCIWNDNQCIGISSCQEFMQYISEDTSKENACNQQQIAGKQCYWLQIQSFSNKYSCISSLCLQFGSSANNCNGSEIQSQLCVLLPNNQCISCYEINDPCTCMNMGNYCYYNSKSGCQSNLCQYMDYSQCLQSSDRCTYLDNSCKQICSKLQMEQCKQRTNDCHWNSNILLCQDGAETEASINTISDVIDVETIQSSLLITAASIIVFLYQ